ncbi:MAG TPA: type I DNA topoisomerase [Halanaerobiales bacterium]|nr:type I DNA topoisomerase [Halanaerobiales bacterium]
MARKKEKTLVIVESPAKAKTITKFLGTGYKVEASMGHVIDLPKSKLGIDIEDQFKPRYITIRGKGKILNRLRKAVKKSDNVLLATDPDREGEAISWHLYRALKLDEAKPRIAFNEITKSAVQNALQNPRSIDDNLVDAQQARRLLDRLVGYKLSPLLWKKVRKGLSAGRVQTVAVRIICDREKEIKAFEPEEYWSISAIFNKSNKEFEAELYRIGGKKFQIKNEKEASGIISELKKESFEVSRVKDRKRKRNPYPPFTTSTLQQRASNVLGFSAKKTMFLAQQLYEGIDLGKEGTVGLISYMRTDSVRVSNEAKEQARKYIENKYGNKYLPSKAKKYSGGQGSQDAHEAIRPTSVFNSPEEINKYLTKDQHKLYKLIWRRFVASQMSPAVYRILTINIKAGKYLFRATGSEVIFPGFLKSSDNHKKDEITFPPIKEGEGFELPKFEPEQHFTKPPSRFTEASLVKTLEEEGIGRPSTYAPTISTIISRGYVQRDGKSLKATELGFVVTEILSDFFPNVTDVEFTASLEEQLDRVEEGEAEWKKILTDFYHPFAKRLEEASNEMKRVELKDEVTDEKCEKCGRPMVIKHGRYGKFLACSGYPECKNTKAYIIKTGVNCPECKNGELIQRKSKKGRIFYGCSNYPECRFLSWNKPVKENCPQCNGLMVEKRSKKRGTYYKCINKDCAYEKKMD